MKKVLLVIGIILVALAVIASGPPDQAEKLKIDDSDWDITPFYIFNDETGLYDIGVEIDGIDCKFGLATAGEQADFTIGITLAGVKIDGQDWDIYWSEAVEVRFEKDPDDTRDEDGYIGVILTDLVSWNGDDDGDGYFVQEVDIGLITPGGNTLSEVPTIVFDDALDIVSDSFPGCGDIPCP